MAHSVIGPGIIRNIVLTKQRRAPANPVQGSVGPQPVEPEAKAKEFEEKLERGKVKTVVEGEGTLVKW